MFNEGGPNISNNADTSAGKRKVSLEMFELLKELASLYEENDAVIPNSPEADKIEKKMKKMEQKLYRSANFEEVVDLIDLLKAGQLEIDESAKEEAPGEEEKENIPEIDIDKAISNFTGRDILPPSFSVSSFEDQTVFEKELSDSFPKRAEIYKRLLDAKTNNLELPKEEKREIYETIAGLNRFDSFIAHYKSLKNPSKDEKRIADLEIIKDEEMEGKLEYRPGQVDVLLKMQDFLEGSIIDENGKRKPSDDTGYFVLPTGFGKTVVFAKAIDAIGGKALVVSPTLDITSQNIKKVNEHTEGMTTTRIDSQTRGHISKEVEEGSERGNITFTTYHSLTRRMNPDKTKDESKLIRPEKYNLVIFDEAHHLLGSPARLDAFDKFSNAIRIGFTATPKYSKEKDLVKPFKNNLIYEMGVKEGIEEKGVLASCATEVARTGIDLADVETIMGDYDLGSLAKKINIKERNQGIVKDYKDPKNEYDGRSTLAFCADTNHANAMVEEFRKAGVSAEAYHHKTKEEEDEEGENPILKKFRSGEIKVLCGVAKVLEGFDAPIASLGLILVPSSSEVTATQRLGRLLRLFKYKDPITGEIIDKKAIIVDYIDEDTRKNRGFVPILASDIIGGDVVLNPYSRPIEKKRPPVDKDNKGPEKPIVLGIGEIGIITDPDERREFIRAVKERGKEKEILYKTLSEVAAELNQNGALLEKELFKFLKEPEDIETTAGEIKISDEGIAKLKELIRNWEVAPAGSKTKADFKMEVQFTLKEVNYAGQLIEGFLKPFKGEDGKLGYFITPDKQREIIEKVRGPKEAKEPKKEEIPAGSVKLEDAYEEFGRSRVQDEQRKLLTKKSTLWRDNSRQTKDGYVLFPSLMEYLRKELREPGNYVLQQSIAKISGVSPDIIERIANEIPGLQKERRIDKDKRVSYSPNAEGKIISEIGRRRNESKKEGEFSRESLTAELVPTVIKRLAEDNISAGRGEVLVKLGAIPPDRAAFDEKTLEPISVYGDKAKLADRVYASFYEPVPPGALSQSKITESEFYLEQIKPLDVNLSGVIRSNIEEIRSRGYVNKFRNNEGTVERYFTKEGQEFLLGMARAKKAAKAPATKETPKETEPKQAKPEKTDKKIRYEDKLYVDISDIVENIRQPKSQVKKGLNDFERIYPQSVEIRKGEKFFNRRLIDRHFDDVMKKMRHKS